MYGNIWLDRHWKCGMFSSLYRINKTFFLHGLCSVCVLLLVLLLLLLFYIAAQWNDPLMRDQPSCEGQFILCVWNRSLNMSMPINPSRLLRPLFLENRSGELRTQKLTSRLVRTQSLNVLPVKPGVGQHIATHATLTVRNFFLISTLPVHSLQFFQNLSRFFVPALAVANTGFCVGSQNKTGHPAGCRFPCWVPTEYK